MSTSGPIVATLWPEESTMTTVTRPVWRSVMLIVALSVAQRQAGENTLIGTCVP